MKPEKVRMKHDDKMYFGKHTGTPLEEVPAAYLLWLFEQPWFAEQHLELHEYIEYHYEEIETRNYEDKLYEGIEF